MIHSRFGSTRTNYKLSHTFKCSHLVLQLRWLISLRSLHVKLFVIQISELHVCQTLRVNES